MFRRSKIKITPKIPQAKPSGDRTHVESLTHVQTSSNLNETNISNNNDQTNQLDKVENKSSTVESLEPKSIITTPKLPNGDADVPMVDLTSSSLTTELVESQPEVNQNNNTIIEKTSIVDESIKTSIDIPTDSPTEKAKVNEVSKKTQTVPKLTTLIEPVDDPPQPSVTQPITKELPKESPTIPSPIIRDKLQADTVRPRKRIKISPKDLLDRSSITLYHLIHAPISRGKRTDKNKNKDKDKDKKLDEICDENVEKISESGDSGKQETSDNKLLNEDTMDSVITTVSSASTIITNYETSGIDKTQEKESIGPRVKVGPDGELIIDEESLVIKKPKPVERETIEEPAYGKTTYSSFRKRPPTARWTKTETIEFYTALNLIGPDFSLMSNLFFNGKRSRTDLKNKFRRENKLNKSVIDKALYEADVEYCLAQEAVQSNHS